ncbi:MAG: hydroxypyruvate isomerase [Proteobacteria bacterium]|nr:hydroxypyruvate isomerase [Pseudomonadota bacterium]
MPRFAANLSMMFTEAPFIERFALAKRAGFDAVEFLFPYAHPVAELKAVLDQTGIRVVLHNLPAGNWDAGDRGMACDPARVAEFKDGVGLGIEYAKGLASPNLHCMAGKAPAGVDRARLHETFVSNLRYAAAETKKAGLGLLIEPINTYDIPGYFINYSREGLAILDEVGADNLKLQYDIYHMQRMEGELAATMAKHLARIGHIQLADNPGRNEPGTGEINYPFLFAHLDKIGYQGWIGCEYKPAGNTEAGLGWYEAARKAGR